jgi:hypothetical protein
MIRSRRFAFHARSVRALLAALSLLLVSHAHAFATTTASTAPVNSKETSLERIQRAVAKIDAEASTPEGEADVVQRLSTQLSVPPDTLTAQHENWGVGYGEVAMVYGFARASKKPITPDQVVEMRRSGMDWDAIAKNLGVKVDTVATRMKKNAGAKPTPHK